MKKPKMLCIIPARGGSKGIPRKNVRDFCGKPLIAWTIEAALKSDYVSRVIVSTDDEEIEQVSLKYGAHIIKRPNYLASDTVATADAVFHTLEMLDIPKSDPNPFIMLQCTSPLRGVEHINEACETFMLSNVADSLVSVNKVQQPPWWYKTIGEDMILKDFIEYDKTKFVRRQDFPSVYTMNGAIYIVKTKKLYEYHDFEAGNVIPYIMSDIDSTDIDTEEDFIYAEKLMRKRLG